MYRFGKLKNIYRLSLFSKIKKSIVHISTYCKLVRISLGYASTSANPVIRGPIYAVDSKFSGQSGRKAFSLTPSIVGPKAKDRVLFVSWNRSKFRGKIAKIFVRNDILYKIWKFFTFRLAMYILWTFSVIRAAGCVFKNWSKSAMLFPWKFKILAK